MGNRRVEPVSRCSNRAEGERGGGGMNLVVIDPHKSPLLSSFISCRGTTVIY